MELVRFQEGQDASGFREIPVKKGDVLVLPVRGLPYIERFSDLIKALHAEGARRLESSSG